jgi:hypothetical protein
VGAPTGEGAAVASSSSRFAHRPLSIDRSHAVQTRRERGRMEVGTRVTGNDPGTSFVWPKSMDDHLMRLNGQRRPDRPPRPKLKRKFWPRSDKRPVRGACWRLRKGHGPSHFPSDFHLETMKLFFFFSVFKFF